MPNKLITHLRKFIKDKNADALLVNSTNEFLVEYNQLEMNARYHVTGFTGSTGDVLVTMDDIFLFVDGRYHEQADIEVDKNIVTVVKLAMGQSFQKELAEKIGSNKLLLAVSSKISQSFADSLETMLNQKHSSVNYIDVDPVFESIQKSISFGSQKIIDVPVSITSKTSDDKFIDITKAMGNKDFTIISALEDVAYLTNKRSFDVAFSSYFYAKAIVSCDNCVVFSDCDLGKIGNNFVQRPLSEFSFYLQNISNSNIFVEERTISKKDFNLIKSSNKIKSSDFFKYKTIKTDSEISHYKNAFQKTEKALSVIEQMLDSQEIFTEKQYHEALIEAFYKNGAQSLSFNPIVAAGENSSIVHYSHPSPDKQVMEGDYLLVDCGGYYDGGFATDITRTFVKGTPTKEQKNVYTTVLKAFLKAYNSKYSESATWFDIDKNARELIELHKIEGYVFSHSTGHGVGIGVHESPPYIAPSPLAKNSIKKNVVFTIEPGIYKQNVGGVRLENTVYIKDISDFIKIESLSKFKFDDKLINFDFLSEEEKTWLKDWQELGE